MLPFNVDKNWYERYWLTDRKRRTRRPVIRPLARLVVFIVNNFADLVIRWVKTRRQLARDRDLISRLSDRELWDMGIVRSEIPRILNGPFGREWDWR